MGIGPEWKRGMRAQRRRLYILVCLLVMRRHCWVEAGDAGPAATEEGYEHTGAQERGAGRGQGECAGFRGVRLADRAKKLAARARTFSLASRASWGEARKKMIRMATVRLPGEDLGNGA